MPEIQVSRGDNGTTIQARAGDTIVVRLPESPTTGYRWAIAQSDGMTLALRTACFEQAAGGGIGGGGTRVFRFEALTAGTADVRMKLWREWEGDRSILDRFHLAVQIS